MPKNLKLGDRVKFQHHLVKSKNISYKNINYSEMFEFCKRYGIDYREDECYFGGYYFGTQLRVTSFNNPVTGIIVGKRNIDLDGYYDYEYGWIFRRRISVYLVAISMKSFCRVPEEYLESIGGDHDA